MGATDDGRSLAPLCHSHDEADVSVEILWRNEEGLEANDQAYERTKETSNMEEAGRLEDGSQVELFPSVDELVEEIRASLDSFWLSCGS